MGLAHTGLTYENELFLVATESLITRSISLSPNDWIEFAFSRHFREIAPNSQVGVFVLRWGRGPCLAAPPKVQLPAGARSKSAEVDRYLGCTPSPSLPAKQNMPVPI